MKAIAQLAVLLAAVAVPGAARSGAEAAAAENAAPAAKQDATIPKKPRVRVSISKETTYITEPLRPDGYPDYIAALNQLASKGVTPENNAAVLLWRALGGASVHRVIRDRFFKMLGMPVPPEGGDYYLRLQQHLQKTGLIPKPAEVEPGDEGLDQAYKQLDEAMKRPWRREKFPALAGWLAANEKPLALVVEAARRPRLYDPLLAVDESDMVLGVLLPGAQAHRHLARPLQARAMLRLGQGKADAAWADLLACHRLGRLSAQGPTLVQSLVGIAIESIACRGDEALLQHGRLSAGQVRAMRADLDGLAPMPKMVDKIDLGERFMYLDCVTMVARDGIDKLGRLNGGGGESGKVAKTLMNLAARLTIDWDTILRMGNSWYDRMVDAYRKPTRAERQKAFGAIDEDIKKLATEAKDFQSLALSALGNPRKAITRQMGKIFIALLLPAVTAASQAEDRGAMQFEVTRLGFALAAYRADHGAYPAKLSELTPKYVAEVPKDIFSTEPLRYRRRGDGYLLYSVGVNGTDDGGRGYDDRERAGRWGDNDWDDLSVRVPADKKDKKPEGKKQ